MTKTAQPKPKPAFAEAARAAEYDEDDKRWEKRLRVVGGTKPEPVAPPKSKRKRTK